MPQSAHGLVLTRWSLVFLGIILFVTTFHSKADSVSDPAARIPLAEDLVADLGFVCDPPLGDCTLIASSDSHTSWQCSDYNLDVALSSGQETHIVSFQLSRADGEPFDLHDYSARVVVPHAPGDAVWCYNRLATNDIMATDLTEPHNFTSAANTGIPFVSLVDGLGNNRLSMGLLSQDHKVHVLGELGEAQGTYSVSITQEDSLRTDLVADAFFVSRTRDSWFQRAKAYTTVVDESRNYQPLSMPSRAYNSAYDSWYWTFDRIDQDLVWRLAQRSRSLGFGSYLLDAGWDTHAGEYFLWHEGSTGDYRPPEESFPDLAGLLNRIRNELGMNVIFWTQHYAIGRRSAYYPEMAGALSQVFDEETQVLRETPLLCPRTSDTRGHLVELFGRLMDDYRPDAFWFDWQEDIPFVCSAPHSHEFARAGEGYNATQQAILDTIRQRDPNVFMEMRWPFANLNNKPYVQLWQPTDSPEDFEAMRLRAMNMRPFSSGVLMGTDEMYWNPSISDAEAARYMATVVFTGVPYFGPDLLSEPSSRLEMLRSWLQFYKNNREDLTNGEFTPYGDRNRPDQVIEGSQATFIYYGNRYSRLRLSKTNPRIYFVNASSSPGIEMHLSGLAPGDYEAAVSDLYLRYTTRTQKLTLAQTSEIRNVLPVGCLLTLSRIR